MHVKFENRIHADKAPGNGVIEETISHKRAMNAAVAIRRCESCTASFREDLSGTNRAKKGK